MKSLAELAPAGRDKAAAKVARRAVARKVARDQIAAHLGIIAVVAVISFPLYYAFVISTQSMDQAISRPPLLLPSVHAVSNYVQAWVRADMGRLLLNSLVVAARRRRARSSCRSCPRLPSSTLTFASRAWSFG